MRRGNDRRCRSGLDDPSAIHNGDAVGDGADHGKIVRNEQTGNALFFLQVDQKLQDPAAHGHIERRDRLIENQQRGPCRDRPRNRHTLPLSAGERPHRTAGMICGEADTLQQLGDLARTSIFRDDAMDAKRIVEHCTDARQRIEGSERILKHHLHTRPPAAQRRTIQREPILSLETDRAGIGSNKPQQDAR